MRAGLPHCSDAGPEKQLVDPFRYAHIFQTGANKTSLCENRLNESSFNGKMASMKLFLTVDAGVMAASAHEPFSLWLRSSFYDKKNLVVKYTINQLPSAVIIFNHLVFPYPLFSKNPDVSRGFNECYLSLKRKFITFGRFQRLMCLPLVLMHHTLLARAGKRTATHRSFLGKEKRLDALDIPAVFPV